MMDTTHWQLVGFESVKEMDSRLTRNEALSGASATIASDALMNPFDGRWFLGGESGNLTPS